MVNTSSLPGVAGVSFDLDSQGGVMQVLAAVRTSDLTTPEKNELRDLVFLYSNGGKEPTVRRALEQKIALHRLVPPPPKVAPQTLPPQPTIGKFRTPPTFATPAPVANTQLPDNEPTFTANSVWVHPEPKNEPVVEVPVSAEIPVSHSDVEPTPVLQTSPAPTISVGDNDAYLMRIREIKALVNEQVGNPVNLVDIDNEVGREYMGALLDAMKKINSGTSAASAMKRLESAYASVEETLRTHKSKNIPVQQSVPTPVYEPPVAPSVSEPLPVVQEAFVPPTPPAEVVYTSPAPAIRQIPIEPDVPTYTAPTIHAAAEPKVTPVVPLGAPAPIVPKAPESQAPYFASLADYNEKPSPVPQGVKSTTLKETAVAGDPLFTAEVDDGLQQLLLEWPIFKKSGLFGTGPKGYEHPLFKKIAPLQIPLLLAGRFEGATQEIKQSVTDYMNGWRYEQGIIYQQNETFEHYLRRVIRHILDLQKGR